MATRVLELHPLVSIPIDSDLAVIFEAEDLTLASETRLQEIAERSKDFPLALAYIMGLLEGRIFGRAFDSG